MSIDVKENKEQDLSNYAWTEGEKISNLLAKTANAFIKVTSLGFNSLESPKIESKEVKENHGHNLLYKMQESVRRVTNTFKDWYQNPRPFGQLLDTGLLYLTPPSIGRPISFINRAWNYYKTGDTGYNYFNRHNWPGQRYYYAQYQAKRMRYYVKRSQRQINKFQKSFMDNV